MLIIKLQYDPIFKGIETLQIQFEDLIQLQYDPIFKGISKTLFTSFLQPSKNLQTTL